MATKQYSKIKKKIRREKQFKKNLSELYTFFNLSLLQMRLDYEDYLKEEVNDESKEKLSESQLKLIAMDKLLRLYFPNDYICIYDNNYFLMTKDEINFLKKPNESGNLTFIKQSLMGDHREINIKGLILLSNSNENQKIYKKLITKLL